MSPAVPGWKERIRVFVRRRNGVISSGSGLLEAFLTLLMSGSHTPQPSEWRTSGRCCIVSRPLCARCGLDKGLGRMIDGFDAFIPACRECDPEVRRVEQEAEYELTRR